MNSIVLELQILAANPNSDVEELVNKTLMVAKKLKIKELSDWCNFELQGYPLDKIPEYRIFYGHLKVFSPYYGDIPFILPDDVNRLITKIEFDSSISYIRNLLNDKSNQFEKFLPNSVQQYLMSLQDNDVPLRPKIVFYATDLMNIQSKVRQIVLNWALQLEEDGVLGNGIQFTKTEQERAMANQFNIHNMQGIIGNISGGSVQQNIYNEIHIEEGDFNLLANFLAKNGIPLSELSELENALNEDAKPTKANHFGEKVSEWIGNIMTKISSGVIELPIATAAGVLANAISKYYGLI